MSNQGRDTMSDHTGSIAMLPNVIALQALVDRVATRHLDLPGMATFYGPSGHGKSMAGQYVANSFDAVLVQCKSTWAKKDMCTAILRELGLPGKGTINAMAETIAETLILEDRPLIVDEADFLVQKRMIEILRDIHENSKAPVILIGEEAFPQKLRAWERIHNRMLDWVRADEGGLHELSLLARIYAPHVKLHEDLQRRILEESAQNIRRICVNLNKVAEQAALGGLEEMSVSDWGKRAFFTGEAPSQLGRVRRPGGRAA